LIKNLLSYLKNLVHLQPANLLDQIEQPMDIWRDYLKSPDETLSTCLGLHWRSGRCASWKSGQRCRDIWAESS